MPDCRCGAEMTLMRTAQSDDSLTTEVRMYQCPVCEHELRLMAWRDPTMEMAPTQPVASDVAGQYSFELPERKWKARTVWLTLAMP